MKTMVVLSDTHGNLDAVRQIADVLSAADVIVHLGDGGGEAAYLMREYGEKVVSVTGNCDAFGVQEESTFEVDGVRFFACHGHKYGVKSDLLRLQLRAAELGAQVALYGHTHDATCSRENGAYLVNPGTLLRYAAIKSFAYIVCHGGKVTVTINDKRFAQNY